MCATVEWEIDSGIWRTALLLVKWCSSDHLKTLVASYLITLAISPSLDSYSAAYCAVDFGPLLAVVAERHCLAVNYHSNHRY